MTQEKSNLKLLFAIIITALVVGGGVYWWQNSVNSTEVEKSLQNRIEALEKENSELRLVKKNVDQESAKQEKINQNYDTCIKGIDPSLKDQALKDAQFKCDSELYDAL